MHQHDQRTIDRARRILRERVRPAVEIRTAPLAMTIRDLPGEPESFASATAGEFRPAAIGDPWGPAWTTSWLHLTGGVPAAWSSDAAANPALTIAVNVDIGFDEDGGPGFQCEGLVFRPDGSIVKGIHPRNRTVPVSGTDVDLFVEAAANPDVAAAAFRPTELGNGIRPGGAPLYVLKRAELVLLDDCVDRLANDLDVLVGWATQLPADAPRRARIIAALGAACDVLDLQDVPATADAARAELAGVLASPAEPSAHRIAAVAHAHIDSAWLWPTRETLRKSTRTFSNVLALMEQYPEFVFACSQAQQYAWVEDAHPDLFARITERVADGRIIPIGGMWVESDTNLPGGEALVRQFVHGVRYFRDRFGVDSDVVWLPDSFGYTAALPQIAALAGFRSFLTQKLAWHPTNRFPHHTFWWEGIDGTRLFSHMPPVDSYLSELTPAELDHAARNFRDHGGATTSVVPFGHGDGGGGPTAVMLERARRQADLEGAPRIEHTTPEAFFAAAEAEYRDAPTWVGELYLEAHRGTYTSQAAMKQGNRRTEHLLREAELWSATAAVLAGHHYPYEELDRLWKTVLLHQFHDILPGSSIQWVHREAAEEYERVAAALERIIAEALAAVAGEGEHALVANAVPSVVDGIAPLGIGVAAQSAGRVEVERGDTTVLDNGVLRVSIDDLGLVRSVHDHVSDRELLPTGARANVLVLHQDLPNEFDAWDVESHYRGSATDVEAVDAIDVDRTEDGAATVTVRRSFGQSRAVQRITLRPESRQVDFVTEVDWHERERFLKVAFPLDVRTTTSRSEIQFGHVERPTHANTSWDDEKFEIPAHRWVHVGETGFGVAVANDSTYGHDIRRLDADGGRPGTEIRLSLLRAPRYPDPETDQGTHRAAYALVSGATVQDAIDAGLRLNLPARRLHGAGPVAPLVTVTGDGVVVESVKLAEDRSGDVVVRFYEGLGGRTTASVAWGFPSGDAAAVDLHEQPTHAAGAVAHRAATVAGGTGPSLQPGGVTGPEARGASVPLRPFQIVTLRIPRSTGLEEEIG